MQARSGIDLHNWTKDDYSITANHNSNRCPLRSVQHLFPCWSSLTAHLYHMQTRTALRLMDLQLSAYWAAAYLPSWRTRIPPLYLVKDLPSATWRSLNAKSITENEWASHTSLHIPLTSPLACCLSTKNKTSQGCIGMDYLSRSDRNLAGKDSFVLFFCWAKDFFCFHRILFLRGLVWLE